MSRSGYSDGCDGWELIKWRGMVASAIRGKRGQKLLRDLLEALDAMPVKRLIANELETAEGEVCALGAVGKARGLDMSELDPEEPEDVAAEFDIATCLAKEIVYENDEAGPWRGETPEQRWTRVRAWVASKIAADSGPKKDPENPNHAAKS